MFAYLFRATRLRARFFISSFHAISISLAITLGGCSAFDFFSNSNGVGIPSPTAARDHLIAISTGATHPDDPQRPLRAGAYLVASITHTNEKCHAFFEVLERYKQDTDFIQKVLTAGIAAGSPLLALSASATADDVARLTSQIAFGNQAIGFAGDIYAFSSFKEQLKDHVFQSMASYQQSKGIDLIMLDQAGVIIYDDGADRFSIKINNVAREIDIKKYQSFMNSNDPAALLIARSVAVDYASLCSLANMKKIVVDALVKTKTTIEASPPGSPPVSSTEQIPGGRT